MFTWGAIAMAMMLVNSVPTFYGMRFLLGLAEAGFFPGVILYMTYWFTAKERAQIVALFMTANAVCYIFGGPVSGWILDVSETLEAAGRMAVAVSAGGAARHSARFRGALLSAG